MFFAETIHVGGDSNWWMSVAAVAMGMFSVAYSLRFISVFFGKPAQDLPRASHEPPRWMRFPVELLVLACLVVGIALGLSIEPLLHLAVIATLGEATPTYDLAVWHGVNLPLLMSVCALGGGVLLYLVLRRHFHLQQREHVPLIHRLNGAQVYETMMLQNNARRRMAAATCRHPTTAAPTDADDARLAAHPAADGRPAASVDRDSRTGH